jgi:protein-disulfide isomerase
MNKETRNLLVIGLVVILIFVGGVWLLNNSLDTPSTDTTQEKTIDTKLLVKNNSHKLVGKNSKATLVEFSDFQCPACGSVYPIVKNIKEKYKDDITFVYRHFPLDMHKNARVAAQASEAANEQGKFWEMHDLLFKNQTEWGESDDPMGFFTTYAEQLGLNVEQFSNAIKNKKFAQRVSEDQNDGLALGVVGTPTFYLNEKKVEITSSFDELTQQVENAIKK